MNDDFITFMMSGGLIGLYLLNPSTPFFMILGFVGCSFSAANYIEDMINKNDDKIFRNCGLINKDKITPKLLRKIKTVDKLQRIYSIPNGISINKFIENQAELESAFKMPLNVIKNNNYTITLESIKNITFKEYGPQDLKPYELLLGENSIVNMNKFPHVLIGGDTGTGKSRVLLTILTQLINKNKDVDLHLLQVRKSDLGVFKNCKQVKTFSKTLDDVLKCLVVLDMELQNREKLIDNYRGIYNIEDYNNRYKNNKLNYKYVIVDEFSFLNVSRGDSKEEKNIKYQCLKYIKSIINVGRSSGVFFITSLQKPTADSIPSDIKSQLVTRVSMHIQDTPTSIVVLGTDEATKLKERQLVVKTNKTELCYSYTIEHKIVKKYIQDSIIDKPNYTIRKIEHKPTEENTDLKIPLL